MKQYVETVSRGLTLRGFLELPENVEKPPLLIMFHGFTGSKSEKNFLLSRLSREVVRQGTATLRFDYHLLDRAKERHIFGTKMRSVIKLANEEGIR